MALTKPKADMLDMGAGLRVGAALTIAGGVATPVENNHAIDTEAAASTDNLDTLVVTNIQDGGLLLIRAANTARTVVVKHGTGNIYLDAGADLSLDDDLQSLTLRRDGASFYEVARSLRRPAPSYVLITHDEADGTDGGSTIAGSWQTRTINTVKHDTDSVVVSLAANVLTLPAGTYEFEASCAFLEQTGRVVTRLYDNTGAAVLLGPGMAYLTPTYTGQTGTLAASLKGRFTLTVQSALVMQYWVTVGRALSGQGENHSAAAGVERYAELTLRKVD